MKLTAVLSLFCAIALAGQTEKPICNKQTLGQFWPAKANQDRDANREIAQQGELQICSYGTWKYGWKKLSVNVKDLARERQPATEQEKSRSGESQGQ